MPGKTFLDGRVRGAVLARSAIALRSESAGQSDSDDLTIFYVDATPD
jgi:hypothetical protein